MSIIVNPSTGQNIINISDSIDNQINIITQDSNNINVLTDTNVQDLSGYAADNSNNIICHSIFL